jgi:hypothetical protein
MTTSPFERDPSHDDDVPSSPYEESWRLDDADLDEDEDDGIAGVWPEGDESAL